MSDIEIAQKAVMKPINEIGAGLGIAAEHLEPGDFFRDTPIIMRRPEEAAAIPP